MSISGPGSVLEFGIGKSSVLDIKYCHHFPDEVTTGYDSRPSCVLLSVSLLFLSFSLSLSLSLSLSPWWGWLPCHEMPGGDAHMTRNWGKLLSNSSYGLDPMAHEELSPASDPMNKPEPNPSLWSFAMATACERPQPRGPRQAAPRLLAPRSWEVTNGVLSHSVWG